MRVFTKFLSVFLAACILAGLLPAEALADIDPMPSGTGILGQVLDEKTGLPPESASPEVSNDTLEMAEENHWDNVSPANIENSRENPEGTKPLELYAHADWVTYPVEGGNLYFDSTTGTIVDCDIGATSVTIPISINGVAVTDIGGGAFSGCSGLTSIVIPSGVTSIGREAFSGCSGLTSITIPSGVTFIAPYTFKDCSGLTSITIPNGVTVIGERAFLYCRKLQRITIPSSVTWIQGYAFAGSSLHVVYYSGSETQWKRVSLGYDWGNLLKKAYINYNTKNGLIITGNTATNCLKKGTAFEMYVAYYRNDAIDLSAKDFIVVSGNSDILSLTVGGWDDKRGRQYTVTAKCAGSCSITFTNPQDGGGDRIDFNVIDGEAGYTFDGVPKLTIEEGKTTNFYNFCGIIVNDFAYMPHEDVSGSIDYYDVTMAVYNSKNLYGAVTSYQADGEIYSFAVIDKHASYSTSFTDDVKELINSVGDLYYQIKNDSYYSGKSISTETPVKIRVPVGGYLQISNSFNSEMAGLANVIGLLVDGTVRTAKLVDSSGKIIGVDNASGIVDVVLQESMDTLEEVLANNFVEDQISGKIKSVLQKSFKTGTWNLNNYGECVQSFLDNSNELGIDLLGTIAKNFYDPSSMMSITESVVKKVIPTGNLISFLYSLTGMADASLFWLNFRESVKFPSGIFIYAPSTSNSYQSNGVSVTPAQKDNRVTVHAYRVVDTADISGNKYETYSVNMYRDGQKVQPDAPVSVQIPLMPSYNKGSVKVYRINDDGTATNMNATVENGYAVFTTDHFSYYALVDVDTNGVFLSRWTSDGSSVVTLSDPDEAASDAIVCAAAYDGSGKMTDIMFGEKIESGTGQILVAFPEELGEGWELYILTPDHAPICPDMTLPTPSKG